MAEKTAAKESRKSAHSTAKAGEKAPHDKAKNVTEEEARFIDAHADELSKTTQRARWTHTLDEHEDHFGETLATRSHEVIQHWAEERGAQPATVPSTDHDGRPGVLRFDFPGYCGKSLQAISWDEWFKPFDERNLVFLYQEHKSGGEQSNFFHFDNPDREHD